MPMIDSYPGVYIEEVPSGVRSITGVATSITAFVGRTLRGPVNEPVRIQNFSDYQRKFGGIWADSPMSYAVQHYFTNGGSDALIVRVHNGGIEASLDLPATGAPLTLKAANPGIWGNNLRADVDYDTREDKNIPLSLRKLFNLVIKEVEPKTGSVFNEETFKNISVDRNNDRYVETILAQESDLVRVKGNLPASLPSVVVQQVSNEDGSDGIAIDNDQVADPNEIEGFWSLEKTDLFNLLCIPPLAPDTDVKASTFRAALDYCKKRRALLIVDPPSNWNEPADVTKTAIGIDSLGLQCDSAVNGALYFPRVKIPDPLKENRLASFAPCGVVAGVIARTDATRGVWKAPAGTEARLNGVKGLTVRLNESANGQLSTLGVNCLRSFPNYGTVVWGARTVRGADQLASEWKYIPVRRTALFIEESLYRGTKWVFFESNDEPLWSQIRLHIGAFMHGLFIQGAFLGRTPKEAYFVKCDNETTTLDDINKGIVNILVGFAPLKPAEFVMIKLQQIAGQTQT